MKGLSRALVTFAILGGVWGTLAIVGWASDVLPPIQGLLGDEPEADDPSGLDSGDNATNDNAADGNAADGNAADGNAADGNAADGNAADGNAADGNAADNAADRNAADGNATNDANNAAANNSAAEGEPTTTAFSVCQAPADADLSFRVGELLASGPPEVVIGCGDRFVVVGLIQTPSGWTTMRIGELAFSPSRDFPRKSSRPAIGDITGDGENDLLLPFFQTSERGGSRGGRLLLWRRNGQGFARPSNLGSAPYRDVHLADFDGRGGLDFVAINRGRPWGDQPGSARIYQGGTRPRLRAELPAGKWASNVAVLDFDLDGTTDVLVQSDGEVHLHRRVDGYRFEDAVAISTRTYWGMVQGDYDGDGNDDALLGGSGGLALLRARSRDSFAGAELEPLGHFQRALVPDQVVDTNRDGRPDVLAHSDGLYLVEQTPTGTRTIHAASTRSHSVLGATYLEDDILIFAGHQQGAVVLVLATHPRFETLSIPTRAESLHDAPFLANAEVR